MTRCRPREVTREKVEDSGLVHRSQCKAVVSASRRRSRAVKSKVRGEVAKLGAPCIVFISPSNTNVPSQRFLKVLGLSWIGGTRAAIVSYSPHHFFLSCGDKQLPVSYSYLSLD